MRHHRHTTVASLLLAAALSAALAAPATARDLRNPDNRDSAASVTSRAVPDLRSPDARDAASAPVSGGARDLRSPDARDAAAVQTTKDLRSPDSRDAAEGRGTFNAPAVMVVKLPQPPPAARGFDWGDAGIGAGALLGLMALGLGGSFAVAHRKHAGATRHQTATTG